MHSPLNSAESHPERLWSEPDGRFCELALAAAPPTYMVSLRRGAEVLRERRLYGLASARMMAIGWREVEPGRDEAWMLGSRARRNANV